ncbi:hypothetical protein FHX81_1432 [Saccharothrix saharensis]|uniref:Ig-like domain-containing protein n=1 Tax=Saccharothrix saharensis TaxID=571190 RepID=A0A543J8J1_9PSEU|nr:hypothetical protein [Saccharothrix saharensis]TQM79137.1 hypothetical protein FHX81_1432 [Saccharothrix saharensis]
MKSSASRPRSRGPAGALRGAAVLLVLSTVAPTGVAQADTAGVVVCTTSSTWTYSPGVVLVPRPISTRVHDRYTSCASPSGSGVTGGSSSFTVEREAGCLEPVAAVPETRVITWDDGRTSTFSYTVTVSSVPGFDLVTKTGTITAGEYAGHVAQATQAAPTPDLPRCLGQGVQRQTALGTFVIV